MRLTEPGDTIAAITEDSQGVHTLRVVRGGKAVLSAQLPQGMVNSLQISDDGFRLFFLLVVESEDQPTNKSYFVPLALGPGRN